MPKKLGRSQSLGSKVRPYTLHYSHTHLSLFPVTSGAAGVFTDLKIAASAVVRSVGKETSRTVGHKYGADAEQVADDALVATGNTVNIASVRKLIL